MSTPMSVLPRTLVALALALVPALAPALAGSAQLGCTDPGGGPTADASDAADAPADVLADASPDDETSSAALTSAEVAQPGPYAVGVVTLQLEDTSRPTPPNGEVAGAESRTLVTEVWYPAASQGTPAAPARGAEPHAGGAWPVLVYSHGFLSGRRENTALTAHLASLGVVVAAPEYPLTNMDAPGGANVADVANQPGDVRFVVDELLARGSVPGSPFGAVDPERIALMGVSLGALTSLLTTFHPDYRDPRVRAVLAAAAPGCFVPVDFFAEVSVPAAFVHGDLDEIVPYAENAPPLFAAAQPPRWLVTLEGGTHTAFGALAVDVLERLDNPEAIGCAALGTNPSIEGDALARLAEDFGVSAEQAAACPTPCASEQERQDSMNARRQLDLFTLVTVAFFQEQLRGEAAYGRYLDETLAREQPDVRVEVERGSQGR